MIPLSQIESISISNFQSHKRTEIIPAPAGQLTVIVGPSDSGKTAIIRALKWLLYNRPQGDEFIRVGASMVKVSLEAGNDKVIRQRSAAVNRYYIYHGPEPCDRPPTTLEGFGSDVPLEVQEITGVRQTTIGDTSLALNLAEQLDGPFLGSKSISDPVRARVLGKLAGTEEVDHANKQLGTDLYRRNQEKKAAEAEVTRLTEQMEQFQNLPRLQELTEQLGWMVDAAREGIEKTQRLKAIYGDLLARQSQADRWQRELDRLVGIAKAEKLCQLIDDKTHRQARLAGAMAHWQYNQLQQEEAGKVLLRYEFLENASAFACDVDRGLGKWKGLTGYRDKLYRVEDAKGAAEDTKGRLAFKVGNVSIDFDKAREIAQRLQTLDVKDAAYAGQGLKLTCARDMIALHENELARYTGAYRDALLAAGQCPTCGGQIDPEKLKEVI